MSDQPIYSGIRKQIKAKQDEISNYLSYLEPFGTRLTYASIICGAVAVLLNTEVVRTLRQNPPGAASWMLPLGATICSLIATVAAALYKVQVESRLSLLQKCSVRLEGLAALIDCNQLTNAEASKQFQGCLEECPSIPVHQQGVFEAVKGTISEPREGQVVPANFTASGTAQNLGRGITLWLTVEIDDRIWPKEGAVFVDIHGEWSQPVFEDGIAGQLRLSLWAANAEADHKLRAWLDRGNQTRTFPELLPLPGMKRLARVPGIQRVTERVPRSI